MGEGKTMKPQVLILALVLLLTVSAVSAYQLSAQVKYGYYSSSDLMCHIRIGVTDNSGNQEDTYDINWLNSTNAWSDIYRFTYNSNNYLVLLKSHTYYYDTGNNNCYFRLEMDDVYGNQINVFDNFNWDANSCTSSGSNGCTNRQSQSTSVNLNNILLGQNSSTGTQAVNVTCIVPATTVTCPAVNCGMYNLTCPAAPACPTCPTCSIGSPSDLFNENKAINVKLDMTQVIIIAIAILAIGAVLYMLGNQRGGNQGGQRYQNLPQQRTGGQYPGQGNLPVQK
jgi:hypothetical protein